MSRKCITCGIEIDPRRIAILPNTQTCTQHSTAEKKVAVTVQMGEGNHTWIETFAVEREDYDKMVELETGKKQKPSIIESVLDDEAFEEVEGDEIDNDEEDDDTWIEVTDDEDMNIWSDDYTEDED